MRKEKEAERYATLTWEERNLQLPGSFIAHWQDVRKDL